MRLNSSFRLVPVLLPALRIFVPQPIGVSNYCQAELNQIVDIQIVSDGIAVSPYFEGFVFHYFGEGGGYDAKSLPGSLPWPVNI